MKNILIIVGSISKQSVNHKVADFIAKNHADKFNFSFAEIADLPLYTQDWDDNSPASYERLRKQIRQADGVLIISPEHNRNIPAALKNAIDIASRPMGQSVWANKPVGVITVSPAMTGGMAANHSIRNTFIVLNAPVMPAPEAYFGSIYKFLNERGELVGKFVINAIENFLKAFQGWVAKF